MSKKTSHHLASSPLMGVLVIMAIVPILFYQTMQSMVSIWMTNETFTHGFLILPISIWLLWQNKFEISRQSPTPEPKVLLLIASILIIWLISNIVGVQLTQQLSVVALIPAIVWLLYGRNVLLTILFPMMYIFFAVPMGQSLIDPMMEFTADFTVALINLTGIPIYRDGLFFTLPTGSWSVVEECSGVRYIIASLALGTIYAYISYKSNRKRSLFILVSIIVPIIANGLRAFGIVMIGHFSGMELAVGADHLLYGWVFFGIIMFGMFYIGSFWVDPVGKKNEGAIQSTQTKSVKKFYILSIISLISILSVELFAYQSQQNNQHTSLNFQLSHQTSFEAWQYDKALSLQWQPIFNNPDISLNHSYRFGNDFVQLDIAYFRFQREGAEAISGLNKLTNPYNGEWKILGSNDFKSQDHYLKETTVQRKNQKLLVWHWYRIGHQQTPNAYIAKIFEAYNRIFLSRQDAALISIATHLEESKEVSRSRLREFWLAASKKIFADLETIATKQ